MDIIEAILKTDKIYIKDISDAKDLEKKYNNLQLTYEQQMVVDDYIACLMTAMSRKCKIAYVAGTLASEDNYI